jgi:hypothetical protein
MQHAAYSPSVRMIKLTEQRELAPPLFDASGRAEVIG